MAAQPSSKALSVTRLATLIVLLAIAAVFFGDHYFGGKGMLVPHAAERMLAFQLPFAVPGLMIVRGPSCIGLAFAGAAAITLLVPLLWLAPMAVIFSGFTDGRRDVWTPLSLVALIPRSPGRATSPETRRPPKPGSRRSPAVPVASRRCRLGRDIDHDNERNEHD